MFDPMQTQLDRILQQRQMLEQQEQMLRNSMQQYQMPNININNMTPTPANDFGCKWIDDEKEANSLPMNTIGFLKNEPIFIMSGKKFIFNEIVEEQSISTEERINSLDCKINAILERLDNLGVNTLENKEIASKGLKSGKKGGLTDD